MSARLFQLYQLATGACDAVTGLLLLVAPALTMRLMQIHDPPSDLVFISFIGAFVGGVGCIYLLTARVPATSEDLAAAEAMWRATGLIRLFVGVFVAVAFLRRQLEPAWLTVSAVDLALAAFQFWGVKTRLLRHE